MAKVQTVTGMINPSEVDISLMHEHLWFHLLGWESDPSQAQTYDREAMLQKIGGKMKALRAAGASLFVDATPIGIRSDVDGMVRISEESGVYVVASTGFIYSLAIPFYFHEWTVDQFENLFVHELTQGMGTSSVRAGIIKVGTWREHMTELEKRVFRAAARASKRTGAAITTHVSDLIQSPIGIISAREQMEILLDEEGVDPTRVIIGHCDTIMVSELQLEIAKRGVYVAMDHCCDEVGFVYSTPDDNRVKWIIALINAGYANQVLISTDHIGYGIGHFFNRELHFDYSTLLTKFVPMLCASGVPNETVRNILVDNPRRVLPMG